MKRVLVTGGSGLFGVNLAWKTNSKWKLYLLYRNHPLSIEGTDSYQVNLEDDKQVDHTIKKIRPHIIIHAAGLTNIEHCQKYQFEAFFSNVLSARHIARASRKYGCQLIHLSTDHFSKSSEAMSAEDSLEIPRNNYAKTKLEAEYEIARNNSEALVVRTNFFGWGHEKRVSFSDFIVKNLRSGRQITLFNDVFYTPVFVGQLLECLFRLIDLNTKGVVNIVGDDRLSKYQFGVDLAKEFALNKDLIISGSIRDRRGLEPRPTDMSLSNKKLKSIMGSIPLSLKNGMKMLREQEENGIAQKIKNSMDLKKSLRPIYYARQSISDEDIMTVAKTLRGPSLTQGPKVEEFERKVADYVGAQYAVALCNLTSGLHLACLAGGVKSGDSVITSPLSFVASANCILHSGATPTFADINLTTLNIDPEKVEKKCKELGNVKAIIAVHFAGHSCDMKALRKIADRYGAVLIEDAAHALGGKDFTGQMIGSCKDSLMCGFSFHPVKNITTGEGSILTTNDKEVYKQLLRLRSHGITKTDDRFRNKKEALSFGKVNSWYYEMQKLGFNYRITDIQCSLGLSQIKRIDSFMKRRLQIAQRYDEAFKNLKFLRVVQNETRHISGNHLYVAMADYENLGTTRQDVFEYLKKEGVHGHVHYIPIPLQPFYRENFCIPKEDYQMALAYYRSAITLPLYPALSDGEVDFIITKVVKVFGSDSHPWPYRRQGNCRPLG